MRKTGDFIVHYESERPFVEQVFEDMPSENIDGINEIKRTYYFDEPIYYGKMPKDLAIAFNAMRSAYLTFKSILGYHTKQGTFKRSIASLGPQEPK